MTKLILLYTYLPLALAAHEPTLVTNQHGTFIFYAGHLWDIEHSEFCECCHFEDMD